MKPIHLQLSIIITLIWILTILLHTSKCSIVEDRFKQKSMLVSDYCPASYTCEEGSHVLCMYYNPNQIMHPRCNLPLNVSITPELATTIVDLINVIRSKLAFGMETGKNGVYLPRAYGMMRLKWDAELATLAQITANQCLLKHDMCRSTSRFDNPSQIMSYVRFSVPDWIPENKDFKNMTPGLHDEKLTYAVTQNLKFWYTNKNSLTPDMVANCPDWKTWEGPSPKIYVSLVYGPLTHVGCGISAYRPFAQDRGMGRLHNIVLLVCNLNSEAAPDEELYNTTSPTTPEFSERCGCYGYNYEDGDCLCNVGVEKEKFLPTALKFTHSRKIFCDENDKTCDASVVVLPIFTIENAPDNKLVGKQSLRTSIFSRGLPSHRRSLANTKFRSVINDKGFGFVRKGNAIKKDVSPRRDYSNAQRLVTRYLNKNKHRDSDRDTILQKGNHVNHINQYPNAIAEKKLVNGYSFTDHNAYNISDMGIMNEDPERKIINMLDTLEQEVKYAQLNTIKKDIIHEKIRKIYSIIVHKQNPQKDVYENYEGGTNVDYTNHPAINSDYTRFNTEVRNYEPVFGRRNIKPRYPDQNAVVLLNNENFYTNLENESEDKKYRNYYGRDLTSNVKIYPNNGNILNYERRRYYQERLNNLERKVSNYHRELNDGSNRHIRPVKPELNAKIIQNQPQTRPNKYESQNEFYVPERARFLHGF